MVVVYCTQMKFFTKFDDRFVLLADDPYRRTLELNRLKSSRAAYYLGGMVLLVGNTLLRMTGQDLGWGFDLFGVMCCVIAFKHESDIRTLRMVDHLQKRDVARTA